MKGGTARDDERHVARKPRMDAGDDACGARRGKTEKGEGRRLTGGARRGFLFFFSFFFQGCDTVGAEHPSDKNFLFHQSVS